jgi:hypothetical protein
MFAIRLTTSIILGLLAVLFLVSAFTVPAFAATPYLLIGFVLAAGTWIARPRRAK